MVYINIHVYNFHCMPEYTCSMLRSIHCPQRVGKPPTPQAYHWSDVLNRFRHTIMVRAKMYKCLCWVGFIV